MSENKMSAQQTHTRTHTTSRSTFCLSAGWSVTTGLPNCFPCCTFHTQPRANSHSVSSFFLSALPQRPSSVPPQGLQDLRGHRHHHQHQQPNLDRYPQQLIRSPSNGNNFIMQSNNGTSTKPPISVDRFHPSAAHSPAHISAAASPPPPPPVSSIPLPPPMPAQFMSPGSSPWSTLQLPSSGRKDRGRVHNDSCKSFRRVLVPETRSSYRNTTSHKTRHPYPFNREREGTNTLGFIFKVAEWNFICYHSPNDEIGQLFPSS